MWVDEIGCKLIWAHAEATGTEPGAWRRQSYMLAGDRYSYKNSRKKDSCEVYNEFKPIHLNREKEHNLNVMVCYIIYWYEMKVKLKINCCADFIGKVSPLQFLINRVLLLFCLFCGFSADRSLEFNFTKDEFSSNNDECKLRLMLYIFVAIIRCTNS